MNAAEHKQQVLLQLTGMLRMHSINIDSCSAVAARQLDLLLRSTNSTRSHLQSFCFCVRTMQSVLPWKLCQPPAPTWPCIVLVAIHAVADEPLVAWQALKVYEEILKQTKEHRQAAQAG